MTPTTKTIIPEPAAPQPRTGRTFERRRPSDADVATARKRVLLLTHRAPYPPDRGDRIRSYHLLKLLSRQFDVSLACTSEEPAWLQYHEKLSEFADRVAIEPISQTYGRIKGVCALATGKPVTPSTFYRKSLATTIRAWHEEKPFDAVLTFCTGMTYYARHLLRGSFPPPVHVLDLVDVDSAKWASYAEDTISPMRWVYGAEARRLRHIESGGRDHIDAVTVVSDREAEVYRDTVSDSAPLNVVGNGVDLDYFAPLPDTDAHRIAFVGVLDYKPNADGVVWFANTVMPRLRRLVPDATFEIIGRNVIPRVAELARIDGVEVVGSVSDVREHIGGAGAVIAPLLIARGVQNKVLEAMACARTVVCSPQAAAGVRATDGEHLLVADTANPDAWAKQLQNVLTNGEVRRTIAQAARVQVQSQYNWEAQLAPMVELLRGNTD